MGVAETIVAATELYGAAGLLVGLGFVSIGIHRAMPHAGPVTWGGRILLLPGAALLWPWVLSRSIAGGGEP